jgi:ribosomal protein L11 methyltransferase
MDYHAPVHVLTAEVGRTAAAATATRLEELLGQAPVVLERPGHPRVWLELYFGTTVEALLARDVARGLNEVLATTVGCTDAEAWEASFRRSFRVREIGAQLRVCPVWERHRIPRDDRANLWVNPGMSFGTGEHFTTAFCLEMIDRLWLKSRPSSFLDIGAGSGILSIAAALLGCDRIVAVEYDEGVLPYLEDNLRLNQVAAQVEVIGMDITAEAPPGTYEVVCANIYGGLLMQCAPQLLALAERHLVLSGIRAFEMDGVAEVFIGAGATETGRDEDGEWGGLVLDPGRRAAGR